MAGLEIQIGADTSDLDRELNKVEKQLRTLENRRELRVRAGLDTGDLNRRVAETRTRLEGLRTSMQNVSGAASNVQSPIRGASNTLTQFSRIAQDAPFGIMGIGNNLTATAESFANLSREAGGSGNALRAVASSMMGTGGILLAISLVTTGLTYMSQNGLTVKDVFDKMTGAFDENAKAMSDIGKEAAKSTGEEVSNMKAYVSVASNVNLKMRDRIVAVKALQDQYPAYFGNLSKEQILNGNVAGAVNDVTVALRNKALAQAYAGKAGELASKEVELRDKEADLIQKSKDALKQLNKEKKEGVDIDHSELIFKAYQAQLKDVQKEILTTIGSIDKYQKKQNEFKAKSIALEVEPPKAIKAKKTFETPQVSGLETFIDTKELASTFNMMSTIITTGMDKAKVAFDMGGVGMMESLQKLNEGFSGIINNGIVNTLSSLGDAIGGALSSGGNVLQVAGASLLSSLGSILSQLGQMAIATGVAILGIKTSLKTLNPYVAIAAGVALVALGGAVSAKSKSLGNSMGSGSVSGNYDTGANYSSPASSNSYSSGGSSFNGGSVVFEIDGQKLVGVLSNTLGRNTKLGGSLGI